MMLLPHSTFFVILNLFQDNERRCVVLKQVQHDGNGFSGGMT
jgi:hypothetical protein